MMCWAQPVARDESCLNSLHVFPTASLFSFVCVCCSPFSLLFSQCFLHVLPFSFVYFVHSFSLLLLCCSLLSLRFPLLMLHVFSCSLFLFYLIACFAFPVSVLFSFLCSFFLCFLFFFFVFPLTFHFICYAVSLFSLSSLALYVPLFLCFCLFCFAFFHVFCTMSVTFT